MAHTAARRTPERRPNLVRAIGRWSLTAVVINTVVGSAIFGLPAAVAALTGAWSPLAVLLAGACIFPIVLCFAEVGSRFDDAGGPYLYAREAFGPAIGFQVGWLLLWTRLLSGAAVLNVMVSYLAQLVPWAGTALGRGLVLLAAVSVVAVINVRGVRQAAWTVNLFTVAKLLPLGLLIVVGLATASRATLAAQVVATPDWTEAILLLVFAYGGFESAGMAAGETQRPKEDTPFALVTAMLGITAIYALVQLAVVGTVTNAAASKAPIADALGAALGPAGAVLGSLTAIVSTYGWLTGFVLLVPRVLFSMAARRELPSMFGRVHETFRTPHVSIVACAVAALVLGLVGTFTFTATLSAIARLIVYGVTCVGLLRLRRGEGPAAGFVLPAGPVFAAVGILFTLWMLSTRSLVQAWGMAAIIGSGLVSWWASTRGRRALAAASWGKEG